MSAVTKSHLPLVAVLLAACTQQAPAPPPRAVPRPLEPLERVLGEADGGSEETDPLYRVVPLRPVGPPRPEDALVVTLDGDTVTPADAARAGRPVLLVATEETWLVKAAPLLAALDDAGAEVWLAHPDAPIAFEVELRDEPAFQKWLDEVAPGKLRVIHRTDGFELQTNLGKLPGGDPNGPTVPVRGGRMDLKTLQRGFEKVKHRFVALPDVCFVPSFGMELPQIARSFAANWADAETPIFKQICLVYPRPRSGAGR